MRNQPVPLVTGFYADQDRPFSQQDVWNYLPCRAEKEGARSPLMLKTPPGLYPWLELEGAPPVRGMHDCEGRMFAVIGATLYRLTPTGVAVPIGTIPGNGRVSMDHNQRANGQQLTVVNGSAGYVYDTYADTFTRITDDGFPGSTVIRFMDGYMLGLDPAGRFAFSSGAANALDYNTLDRWTSEYRPDRLVGMGRLGGELLLLSANSGEFFGNTGAAQQPFRSKRIFLDKGCAGPHTVVEADNTVFWLGSDGYFYQLDGYNSRRISTRPIEQAIRGQDWWNAFAFVWESEGHTVVYWTFLDGQTWGWDTSQQEWHRRESYGLKRWRPNCTARSNGAWYAGDFQKGRVWRLDWGYPWEGDTEFVSGFTLPVIHDNQNELVHSRLELVMDVGQAEVGSGTFAAQPRAPTITGDAPGGATGEEYGPYTYTITPGDAPIASVVVIDGELPPGLTLSGGQTATVSGTPTAIGGYSFTLRVRDTNGLFADLADTIEITQWRMAYVAAYYGTGLGGQFYRLDRNLVAQGPYALPFAGHAELFKVVNGRLYAGNEADGLWFSTDQGDTWTQCTGLLARPLGDLEKFQDAYVLVYRGLYTTNTAVSRSVDGQAFEAVPTPTNVGTASNTALGGRGRSVFIGRGGSSTGLVHSTDSGASFTSHAGGPDVGFTQNAYVTLDDGDYRAGARKDEYGNPTGTGLMKRAGSMSLWELLGTGISAAGFSSSYAAALDEKRLVTYSATGSGVPGPNVAVGNATDGFQTAMIDASLSQAASPPRSPIAYNLQYILIGANTSVRWITPDLSDTGVVAGLAGTNHAWMVAS